MKRVLAVVGAALLIAIAVVVRGALDDDSDASPSGDDDEAAGEDLVVACVPELADACHALDVTEVRVEDPAATIADPAGVDAWITLDPWPEIAGFQEMPAELTTGLGAASSSVLLLGRDGKLAAGCGDWLCAATPATGAALRRPTSAFGLVSLGIAGLDWAGASGLPGFSREEIESLEFSQWLSQIDLTTDPLLDMLQLGPAGPGATNVTEVEFFDDVVGSREEDNLHEAARPASVVAVVAGRSAEELRQPLQDALVALGWEPADASARSTGVPTAGALVALAQEVS